MMMVRPRSRGSVFALGPIEPELGQFCMTAPCNLEKDKVISRASGDSAPIKVPLR